MSTTPSANALALAQAVCADHEIIKIREGCVVHRMDREQLARLIDERVGPLVELLVKMDDATTVGYGVGEAIEGWIP